MTQAHGGNVRAYRDAYGEGPLLDFSANINPLGVPTPVMEAIALALAQGALERYPDPECKALVRGISERHGVETAQLLCGNGVSELFHTALAVLPKGKVAVHAPAFSEYASSARICGHEVEYIELCRETFVPKPCEKRYTGAILANPNNPTSRALPRSVLQSYLENCEWVLLDEAFIELTRPGAAQSMLDLLETNPHLIILRAFTKSIAIPGLRLGYAIAAPELIRQMRRVQAPWSVNALAQSVAASLPSLGAYEAKTRAWLESEPGWLYERLNSLPGIRAFSPDANFVLCKRNDSSKSFIDALARRGLLIRDASNFESLDGTYFRVAVKLRAENERLISGILAVEGGA